MRKHEAKVCEVSGDNVTVEFTPDTGGCAGCSLAAACKRGKAMRVVIPQRGIPSFIPGEEVTVAEKRYVPWYWYLIPLSLILMVIFTSGSEVLALGIVVGSVAWVLLSSGIKKSKWKILSRKRFEK